ncbi:MAG: hypothetical protein R3301_05040 [Saprospiraceae bacterium]|nr:hypothetical protein [Saprospiraceae bacterium]
MMRTGTTFLQKSVFPHLKGIRYIPKPQFFERDEIIRDSAAARFLISYELAMDEQWQREIDHVSEDWPDAIPIVVVRRHSDWLLSEYKRQLKNGHILQFEELWSEGEGQAQYHREDLLYCDRIAILRDRFSQPPVILMYEDLVHDGAGFIEHLAAIMGATVDLEEVDLQRRHTSYGDRQLQLLRRVMQRVNLNRERGKQSAVVFRVQRLLRDIVRYGILYLGAPFNRSDGPLVDRKVLDRVDEVYQDDWEQVLELSKTPQPQVSQPSGSKG